MQTVNIHEAEKHLSRLIGQAAAREPFGPVGEQLWRLGFRKGCIDVPDDFDRMGGAEIEDLFSGG